MKPVTSEQIMAAMTRCHLRYRRTGEQRWRDAMRELQFAHLYYFGRQTWEVE